MADVRTVLGALAAQPAQVAAGAATGTAVAGADGGGGGGGAMEVEAAGGAKGVPVGGGESTVGYLSSPQLFGLQLRDAAFRRDLLVQVGRQRRWIGGGEGGS